MCLASPRQGEKALLNDFWYFWSRKSTIKKKLLYVSSRVVDGADPYKIKLKYSQQKKQKICTPSRQRTYWIHARHALSAGVQTMRARICSAISCAMFARVVWLRLRRAAKQPIFALPFTARTYHARLARLTRARRGN